MSAWNKTPPTAAGFYWYRYVDMAGEPKEPEILQLLDTGKALCHGSSDSSWVLREGCFEFGPKIEEPA